MEAGGIAGAISVDTPVDGEEWTITLNDGTESSFSYTVGVVSATYSHTVALVDADDNPATPETLETPADIAEALATKINAGVLSDFTAIVDGNVLLIVNQAGDAFTKTFDVAPTGSIGIDAVTPFESTVSFSGKRVAGETWYVLLAADDVSAHGYLVTADQALSEIAAGLAADINTNAAADFTAIVDGEKLLIVNRAGEDFTTSFEIGLVDGSTGGSMAIDAAAATRSVDLGGTPAAGEEWTVSLTTNPDTPSEIKTTYGYEVSDIDTPEDIAAAIASNFKLLKIQRKDITDFLFSIKADAISVCCQYKEQIKHLVLVGHNGKIALLQKTVVNPGK